MVAVALGLIVLAAMLEAFNSNSATGTTNTRFTEVQSNARYAADFLRREIQHTGYLGLSAGTVTYEPTTLQTANYSACGAGFATNLAQRIWGSDDANGVPCIPSADYARGDILVVRKANLIRLPSTNDLKCQPNPAPAATKVYVRSEFMKATIYLGSSVPLNLQPPCEDYLAQVDAYYISPCSNTTIACSASGADTIPSLKRMTLGDGPAFTSQLIAAGIENLQVQYGVQAADTVNFQDAAVTTDWPNVVAVRLWVLARSSDAEYLGYSNTSSYDMGNHTAAGGNAITVNDHYVRQLFPLVVNVRK